MIQSSHLPNRNFLCPHCHATCGFTCVYNTRGHYGSMFYPVSIWSCHVCDRSIFVKGERTEHDHIANSQLRIESIYPTNEPTVDARVPAGIAADFIEATKDFNIGSCKSSVVMARRTIQKMCLNLGATKGKKLHEQINELLVSGKLHPDLAAIATEIRFLGNDGAHPEDDGLDDVDTDDAKEILDFTSELIDDLYVRPQKVEAMRIRRQEGKAQ
jgi:Domain of unknown function (DUF4145)